MDGIRWAFNFRHWSPKKEEWMLCLSLIQQEEKNRIGKFVFKKDAKASLAGRLMVRKVVSESFKVPWSSFQLQRTEKGRPFYCPGIDREEKFDFNISHQGSWVVLAAESNGSKVGIDVMEIEKPQNKNVSEFFRLMRRQFTSEEWSVIKKDSCEARQLKAFYRNWCLKEAFVKSLGVGISYDLQSISFAPHSELALGKIITDTQVTVKGLLDSLWHFEECLIDESHIATVAYQPGTSIHCETSFTTLSFENLILNSQQILPLDSKAASEFEHKDDRPNF